MSRSLPLEDFFLAYRKQDRHPGEFVEAVTFPSTAPNLRCYKISKRFDQDISAVCGCFNLTVTADPVTAGPVTAGTVTAGTVTAGTVTAARIAFGGMAGTPKRAIHVEAALIGRPFTQTTITAAKAAFALDYQPLTDMRASASYRLTVAENLLTRYFHDLNGAQTDILRVSA